MAATRSVRKRHGFRPKKRLGQHFLKDMGVIHEIISRAGFDQSDRVIEIGPGLGALTIPLAGGVREIYAIEKDPELTSLLGQKLSQKGISNVTLINHDILKWNLDEIFSPSGEKMKVIGNLPYNISSPVLEKLVNNRNRVSRAILTFQFEFARRLISPPGSRKYGAISVLIQYYAHLASLLEIPKELFSPKPKVDSMVLEIDFEKPHPRRTEDEGAFEKTVKGAFAQRRKTLLNSLAASLSSYKKEEILEALGKCGIESRRRPETLDIDEFICLTSALKSPS